MNTVLKEQIIGDMRFGDAAFKFKGRASSLYPTFALCWFLMMTAIIGGVAFFAVECPAELKSAFNSVFHAASDKVPSAGDFFTVWRIIAIIVSAFFAFMLLIPMLWTIYSAKEMRTFAKYTLFDGVQFHLNATAGSIVWLTIINLLLLLFTLGIAVPFILQRNIRFVIDRLTLEGAIDIDRIVQSMAASPYTWHGRCI